MKPGDALPHGDVSEEVSTLIEALHRAGQRLEELTGGEVDTVADRDGKAFLLPRAQEKLRHLEAAKQSALLTILAQSEAGLHRAQLMAKLAHVVTGPDGSFEQWSETLPRLVGVELARLPRTTRAWLKLLHPEDRALFRGTAIEAAVNKTRVELEYRLHTGDGRWIHLRQVMEPVTDESDATGGLRWFNTLQDVTAQKQAADRLQRSESLKGAILESSLDSVITIDHEGAIVEFNPAAEATFGFTRAQALGRQMVEMIVPLRLQDAHRGGIARYLATGVGTILGKRQELQAIRADGTEFPIELAVTAIGGTPTPMFTGFIRDITARKEADGKIKRLNRVYAVLSGINTLIVRVRDRDELFREACRIAIEAGQFAKCWIGLLESGAQQLRMVASHGGDPQFFRDLEQEVNRNFPAGRGLVARALATRQPVIANDTANDPEVLLKQAAIAGGVRSVAVLPLVVAGEAVGVFTLNAETPRFFDEEEMKLLVELAGDISFALDHIGKQDKLDYLAYYDVLTGLANRSLFLERVAQYMRSAVSGGHKLALFFLDLERFRNINDSLGRPAGDALLQQIAQWLTRSVGDANLLARVGTDHFAVVLPELKRDGDVARLLDKQIQLFQEHAFRVNGTELRIATKVGIAIFPNDGTDADTLLRNAEAALNRAKASGERAVFYKQKMTELAAGNLTLETQLRQALDNGEFVLHYQPKVSLKSGKLTGAEALIRWNDPRTGLVPPGRFIPVLEETGLIYDVGRWALHKAIEDYLRWRAAGLAAVRIAVNVSPLQLRNRGFVAEIEKAVGIDPDASAGLELEITESLIMEDVKHSIANLQAIRAMGVSIANDDFGTGYSSLSYLSKLPVDTLKIDRSFVVDMNSGSDGVALVSTIIKLGHSLKLKLVAEGVETEEQSRLLRLLNCDEMQGYLFSRPVPGEIFAANFLAPPAAG